MILRNEIVTLQPGLYALRHPGAGMAPLSVSRIPDPEGGGGRVDSLSLPGLGDGMLRGAEDCIVWRVSDRPVGLLATAFLQRDDELVPAVRIQRLDGEGAVPVGAAASDETSRPPIVVAPHGVSIIAYVDGRGDVVAAAGESLGSPDSLRSITGFQLVWPDRPAGVDILYSVSLEGHGSLPTVSTGSFCGVRDGGARITGIAMGLTGEKAGRYRLKGQACFSGGFTVYFEGGVIGGPSGFEHLAALRLEIGACDS